MQFFCNASINCIFRHAALTSFDCRKNSMRYVGDKYERTQFLLLKTKSYCHITRTSDANESVYKYP